MSSRSGPQHSTAGVSRHCRLVPLPHPTHTQVRVMGLPRTVAKRLLAWCALPLGVLATSAAVAQGQQGTITGRITAAGSGEPLQESRVVLVGTSLFATAAQDGRYTIRNVPAGSYTVRVLRVGYEEQKKPVTVAAGEAVDARLHDGARRRQAHASRHDGDGRAAARRAWATRSRSIDAAKVVETAPVSNVAGRARRRARLASR